MKIRDRFWYSFISNKKERRKFVIPVFICSIMIVSVFSFYCTINSYLINGVMKTYDYDNYFILYPETIDEKSAINDLKNIKHIKNVYSSNYDHYSIFLDKINDIDVIGSFMLVGDDEKFENSDINSIICPKHFFPNDNLNESHFIKKNEIINLKNLIDKNFSVSYNQYVDDYTSNVKKINLKLIDVYENNPNIIDENICYAPRELISRIYNDAYKNIDMSNQTDALIINIDNSKNYEYVKKEIEKKGYSISVSFVLNESLFSFVKILCVIISIISIIFVIIVIINLNKRRLFDKVEEFVILRSLGYSEKELKKILMFENFILISCCILVSLGLFIFINCIILTLLNVYPFIFSKIPININYNSYLVFIFIVLILLIITSIYYQTRICKVEISSSLGD